MKLKNCDHCYLYSFIQLCCVNYNIPNYNIEQDFRPQKRGGGVCLYLHSVIQYKLRNDLKLGNNPELINSVFIEIENQQ